MSIWTENAADRRSAQGERLEELIRVFTHDKTFAETKIRFAVLLWMRRREAGRVGKRPFA
jgi:hypothetical protein